MLSMRFSGPVQAIQELRDTMRLAGAHKVGYRGNNDGLTARLYVDFGAEASLAILATFRGVRPRPTPAAKPVPATEVVIEAAPVSLPLPSPVGGRFQVNWR